MLIDVHVCARAAYDLGGEKILDYARVQIAGGGFQ
jgi:hypothetical protein